MSSLTCLSACSNPLCVHYANTPIHKTCCGMCYHNQARHTWQCYERQFKIRKKILDMVNGAQEKKMDQWLSRWKMAPRKGMFLAKFITAVLKAKTVLLRCANHSCYCTIHAEIDFKCFLAKKKHMQHIHSHTSLLVW